MPAPNVKPAHVMPAHVVPAPNVNEDKVRQDQDANARHNHDSNHNPDCSRSRWIPVPCPPIIMSNHSPANVQSATLPFSTTQELPPSASNETQFSSTRGLTLEATLAKLYGRISTEPYQQPLPPNGFAGTNPQTPGIPVYAPPLDPAFRDAAKRNDFIAAFVAARDKIQRGEV